MPRRTSRIRNLRSANDPNQTFHGPSYSSRFEDHEIKVRQRKQRGDRSPDGPAFAKPPITLWNGLALLKGACDSGLSDLSWNKKQHPNDGRCDEQALSPDEPCLAKRIKSGNGDHAISPDQDENNAT